MSGKIIVSLKGRIQLGDIAGMVLAMVNFHGAGIDGGFKFVKVISEGRKFISHSLLQIEVRKSIGPKAIEGGLLPSSAERDLNPVLTLGDAKANVVSLFDHEDGLGAKDQSAVRPEMPGLQMQLVVVPLELQD